MNGPGFRGHFFRFAPAAGFTNICDKSAGMAIGSNIPVAYWHIAYKDASHALAGTRALREAGRAVQEDSQGDGAKGASTLARRILLFRILQLAERSGCRPRRSLLQFERALIAWMEPLRCGGFECENPHG